MHYLREERGLSCDVSDKTDITPLHLVCAHGHLDMLDYLLRNDVRFIHNSLTSV